MRRRVHQQQRYYLERVEDLCLKLRIKRPPAECIWIPQWKMPRVQRFPGKHGLRQMVARQVPRNEGIGREQDIAIEQKRKQQQSEVRRPTPDRSVRENS